MELSMTPNATPFYDSSDNVTGCCPRFNPAGWDGAELEFINKPFLRAKTVSVAYIPLNMGKVFTRVNEAIEAADAAKTDQTLVLSRELSAFSAEHLFAVEKPVPGEEMTTLSGRFLTKVFEGPYSEVPDWHSEMETLARKKGDAPGTVWFFYTTCPKCQKVYGKNPVVGLVELTSA
jgi:hypothetical protein